jgi:hypothetical protein
MMVCGWWLDYLDTAHRGGTLDLACELVHAAGGEPWWTRQRRDGALRELAAKHYTAHPAPTSHPALAELRQVIEVQGRRIAAVDRGGAVQPAGIGRVPGLAISVGGRGRTGHALVAARGA